MTSSPAEEHRGPGDRLYVTVWASLVFLTLVTVGVTYLDMKKFAVFTAMAIATTKCGLVATYFMHLRYESRLYTILLMVALATLAVFMALTFSDLLYRDP
jgi:cytochrome c oxidase subunit 4